MDEHICPKCKSANIDLVHSSMEDMLYVETFNCLDCGCCFENSYTLEFQHTNILKFENERFENEE